MNNMDARGSLPAPARAVVISAAVLLLMYYWIRKRNEVQKRRKRRWWVHPINQNRVRQGYGLNLSRELRSFDEKHHDFYRMNVAQFNELLSLVMPRLEKSSCVREAVPPEERLSITLRRLATGDSPQSLAFAYRRGVSTIRAVVYETCDVLWDVLQPLYLRCPTEKDWIEISRGFLDKWDFPNCIGAIDGKHVTIRAPPNTGSSFFNYKKTFSIVLMALCDASYKYTMVHCGEAGRWSDGGVFEHSGLKDQIRATLPEDGVLPGTNERFPYCIVGDEAFPIKTWLMRPYPGRQLTSIGRKIFNFRLSRARRTIENCFGITAARWRILLAPINASPDNGEKIVKACTVLHNYMRTHCQSNYTPAGYMDSEDPSSGAIVEGQWRNDVRGSLPDFRPAQVGNYSNDVKLLRERLLRWFTGVGNLGWEEGYVSRTS